MMRFFRILLAMSCFMVMFAAPARADNGALVPANGAVAKQPASISDRVTELEAGINSVSQQVKSIQGQLQVQADDLLKLHEQQRNFFKDLNQRINQLQNLENNTDASASNDPSPGHSAALKAKAGLAQTVSSLSKKEQQVFQQASAWFSNHEYSRARTALVDYLIEFPQGAHLAAAHLQLGQVYQRSKQESRARDQFLYLQKKYPNSLEAAKALKYLQQMT